MSDNDSTHEESSPSHQNHSQPNLNSDSPSGISFSLAPILIALLGIIVSAYATYHHLQVKALGSTDAFCNISDKLSCDRIAQSAYSEFLSIPVAAWGLGYFIACLVVLWASRSNKSPRAHLHTYVLLVVAGVLVSLVLGGISAVAIKVFCPTCIAVYVVCLAQAAYLYTRRKEIPMPIEVSGIVTGGGTAIIAVAITLVAFNLLRPALAPSPTTAANTPGGKPAEGAGMMVLPNVSDIPLNLSAYSGLGEDYRRGSESPKLTIVEFADFQCPACQSVAVMLHRLVDEFGTRVMAVFKNYPLDPACNSSITQKFHEHACSAAIIGRCAGQYGKFWNFHDRVYEKQSEMNGQKLRDWAQELGLSGDQIDACAGSKDVLAKIKDDVDIANKLGIEGTPTLYFNGKKYVGPKSYEAMREYVIQVLAQ